jgi:RNA polymerase sigma factor (sigma-70 family)
VSDKRSTKEQSGAPQTDETAALLADWHARYRTPLMRFFSRRTRADVDREDLTQEVFARLARHGDLKSVERVEPYLFQTAASVLTDFLRRRRVRSGEAHVPLSDELADATDLSPERVLLGKRAVEHLARALGELPERTQTIFALYHLEDVPHREIARRLGVSVSTVEKEMARANHHLLKRLEPHK